jgi:vacuolar-type H+-ATPase subunit H
LDLDRQTIEKRDFPIGRRGYEPEAVDAHLAHIAREVDALERQARSRSGESLASVASTQVQAIVEAAESSAADIERQAQMEATRIRQDAEREAERTRDDAVARAREHVNKVSEATSVMLQRVDAMESELGALFESLRTGANRLNADLALLDGNMGELYDAAGGSRGDTVVAPDPAVTPGPYGQAEDTEADGTESEPAPALESYSTPGDAAAPAEAFAQAAPAAAPAQTSPAPVRDNDVEGARLIALNMALNGQSREEADRYLAENFDLADRAALLDEVYASVQG